MRLCVARDLTRVRHDVGQGIPVVRVHDTRGAMCALIGAPLTCGRLTTTEDPGHGSPWATIHGFTHPDGSCVDGINGHLSSHSTAGIAGAIVGFSVREAACRIQASVVGRETPQRGAKKPQAACPRGIR